MILRLLLFVFLPFAALAETVTLQSGEHADFSRLVMQFPNQIDWKIGRVFGAYELWTPDNSIDFDTGAVFSKIPKTRMRAVKNIGQGRLRIEVNDGVHLDAFEIRAGRLVIDVKDGTAQANAIFESELVNEPVVPPEETQEMAVQSASIPEEKAAKVTPSFNLPLVPNAAGDPSMLPIELEPAPQPRVMAMEQALLAQLGRAASQGLLDANIREPEPPKEEITVPDQIVALPEDPPEQDLSHVRVRTRIDIDAGTVDAENALMPDGGSCLPAKMFDVAEWGKTLDEGIKISEKRSRILGEFDQVDATAVRELAQYYIYLTFGAEALGTMADFGAIVTDADILRSMAEVIDSGSALKPGRLNQQLSCATPGALWAALARERLSPGDEINRQAILRAFSTLPAHLRKFLGPSLSERFLGIDDESTALSIRNAMERAPGEHGDAYDLLDARLMTARGYENQASEKYDKIVGRDGSLAPVALAEMLETMLANGEQLPEGRILDAEALAFELQNDAIGTRLIKASIGGVVQNGRPVDALAGIDAAIESRLLSVDESMALKNKAYLAAAESAEELAFLRLVIANFATGALTNLDRETKRALAARLLKADFPEPATDLLNTIEELPAEPERLLYAQAALKLNKPEIAIGYLAGLEGAQVNEIRANAMSQIDRHVVAADMFVALNDPDRAAREAWLSGDLSLVETLGAQNEAALAIALRTPAAESVGPLDEGRALVSKSADIRKALESVLR